MYVRQMASALTFSMVLASSSALSEQQAINRVKSNKVLETSTTWTGQKIEYPETDKPTITSLVVEIPPGVDTGWHMHPATEYVYVLEGTVLIEDEDENKKELKSGQSAVEVNNYRHGMNSGNTTTKLLVVFIGQNGQPLTISQKTQ